MAVHIVASSSLDFLERKLREKISEGYADLLQDLEKIVAATCLQTKELLRSEVDKIKKASPDCSKTLNSLEVKPIKIKLAAKTAVEDPFNQDTVPDDKNVISFPPRNKLPAKAPLDDPFNPDKISDDENTISFPPRSDNAIRIKDIHLLTNEKEKVWGIVKPDQEENVGGKNEVNEDPEFLKVKEESSDYELNSNDEYASVAEQERRKAARKRRDYRDYTGRKGLPCRSCDYIAPRPSHLSRHVDAVHLKIKPFACPYCKSEFGYKHHMAKHVSDQHGKSIYPD